MRSLRHILVCLPPVLLSLFTLHAWSDVPPLPPQGVLEAQSRMNEHPEVFDKVDTFCDGKKVGAACSMPGNHFSGGGQGKCSRAVNQTDFLIELTCVRDGTLSIDRKEPESGYVDSPDICPDNANVSKSDNQKPACVPRVPNLADRFCLKLHVKDVCAVEFEFLGVVETAQGICQTVTEHSSYYHYGRHYTERDVLQCQPLAPVVHTYRRVSAFEKFFQ